MSQKNKSLPARVLAAIGLSKTFGERLKVAWKLTGTNVPELAERIGSHVGGVYGWGRNESMPEPEPLRRLAAEMGVPKGLLLFGKGKSMRTRLAETSGLGETLFLVLKELSDGTPEHQVEKRFGLSEGTLKNFFLSLWKPHRTFADRGDLLIWLTKDAAIPEVNNTLFIRQLEWGQQFDLTAREVRVLNLFAEGRGSVEIADFLGVDSSHIIGRDTGSLKKKLGLPSTGQSRATLIRTAVEKGFPLPQTQQTTNLDETQQAVFLFENGKLQWAGASLEVRRFFVQSLADFLKKPVAQLNTGDFTLRVPTLGFKTIRGLLSYYERNGISKKEALDKLLGDLGYHKADREVQQFIDSLKSGRLRNWSSVPKPVRLELLKVLAKHVKKPVGDLRSPDFHAKVPAFGYRTLAGLLSLYRRASQSQAIEAIHQDLGLTPTPRKKLGSKETLDALRSGGFRHNRVSWEETTLESRRHLLNVLAGHFGKTPEFLNTSDLRRKVPPFNNRSLVGLLDLYRRDFKDATPSEALAELKRSLHIADLRIERETLSPADLSYEDMDEVVAVIGDIFGGEDEEGVVNIRKLEKEEEFALADLIQKGNKAAWWILVGSQSGYLRYRARLILQGYGLQGADVLEEELVNEGERVLQQSALRYRPIKEATLATFAWKYVGQAMRQTLVKWARRRHVKLDLRRARARGDEEDGAVEEVAVTLGEMTLYPEEATDSQYKSIFLELLTGKSTFEVADEYHVTPYRVRQIRREVLAALNQHRSVNGSTEVVERAGVT